MHQLAKTAGPQLGMKQKWLCRGRMIPYKGLDLSIQGHNSTSWQKLQIRNYRVDTEVDVQGAHDPGQAGGARHQAQAGGTPPFLRQLYHRLTFT